MGDDLHAAGCGAAGHIAGDAAETEQPQRLAANLSAHHAFARPSSRSDFRAVQITAARKHEQTGHDVFRHGNIVRSCRWNNGNVSSPAFLHVDIVQPDAKPADNPQVSGGLQQRSANLGLVAYNNRTAISNKFKKFVLVIDKSFVIDDIEMF